MESSCFANPLHLSKLGSTIAAQAAWNAVYQQKRIIYNSISFDTNSMHMQSKNYINLIKQQS
jgi:hypothetical protein